MKRKSPEPRVVETGLVLKDIVRLLEACKKSGVSELVLGGLQVVFKGQTKDSLEMPTASQTKEAEVQSQIVEKEALTQASEALDERDLAVMQIEDPVRYEQLMIERQIEDDGPGGRTITEHEQSIIDAQLSGA